MSTCCIKIKCSVNLRNNFSLISWGIYAHCSRMTWSLSVPLSGKNRKNRTRDGLQVFQARVTSLCSWDNPMCCAEKKNVSVIREKTEKLGHSSTYSVYIGHQALSPRDFQARMLERVAVSSSRVLSQPRVKPTASHVPCIASGFLISWAIQ